MLANNNKAIINKLAKNTIQTNKRKFGTLFFTVALSAFMLFSVFTIGITYLDLSRLQNTRLYGAEFDAALVNGFSEEQKEVLMENPDIQTVGSLSYAGYVRSTDADDTVNLGLLWCDDTFWKIQHLPVRTRVEGHYPQKENELMVTRKALKDCGKESLSLGDSFPMTFEDNMGIHTKEFTISGIWEGYGDQSVFYVSKAFYKNTGYELGASGILYIKFTKNYVTNHTIEKLKQRIDLMGQQVFQVSDYIEKSLTIRLGIGGLCFIICLSAYLLIYNILYLSVSGRIRYYGLLQTLGMTKKQLVQFMTKQMLLIGIAGILLGILLGIFTSLVLVPYVMEILGISAGNMEMQFYPAVLVFSILTTGIAMLCGIRKPIRIAANVTPVEAVKYRGTTSKSCGYKKVKKGSFFWRMAVEQLKKDKKKMVVFLSLATSLSVFYCLTTIISSQGERTVLPNYWDADYVIRNDTQTSEEIASLQPAINDEFLTAIEKIDGIKEIHAVMGVPVILPYGAGDFSDMWIKNYVETKPYMSYSDTVSDYRENPEKYYGMVKGIDEAEFDYLNQLLSTPIDKQDFLSGKVCIIQYAGFEIPQEYTEDKKLTFYLGNQPHEITIGAISYEGDYGASMNVGANMIVSQEYLKTLTTEPDILRLNIKYNEIYDTHTENEIRTLLENSSYGNDLYSESKLDNMKTIQDSQGNLLEVGTVIALLLLLVGVLNYANTMASSIQNRRLTFSVMESIGMSGKQIRKLLIREGLLYAVCSVFITLTVGTVITYICFQSMNYMGIPFSIPVIPLLGAIALVMLICVITPLFSYRKLSGKRSIVERLREYE